MNVVIQFLALTVGYFARMDLKQKGNVFEINSRLQCCQNRLVLQGSLIQNLKKMEKVIYQTYKFGEDQMTRHKFI